MQSEFSSKGVNFFGVALERNPDKAQAWVDKNGVEYSTVLDGSNKTARAYGVQSIPFSALIDPEGNLVWTGHPNQLEEQLQSLTDKNPELGETIASKKLKAVKLLRRQGLEYEAYTKLRSLVDRFEDTESGKSAANLLTDIEANETVMEIIKSQLLDKLCQNWLDDADTALIDEDYEGCIVLCEKILNNVTAASKWGAQAYRMLNKAKRMIDSE